MSLWSNYLLAGSIPEAVDELSRNPEETLPIAGGTDLLIELTQGRHAPVRTLVDVTRIPELGRLALRGDELFIGAAVTVREIAGSPLVRRHAAAVAEACALIGGPQVRSSATLGGNVAHALPAADGMIALAASGAVAEVAGRKGTRRLPVLELFLGPGSSALRAERDLLVGFWIPAIGAGEASAFGRLMRPQGVALPILNAAVWIARDGAKIREARIAVGPSGPVPTRAAELERLAAGRAFGGDLLREMKRKVPASFSFRSSPHRAGADYRYRLCGVLLEEVMTTAWKRAGAAAAAGVRR